MNRLVALSTLLSSLAVTKLAAAQTPDCDNLSAAQQTARRELFAALHPYDGCDATFEQCLANKPAQPVVLRQASDLCRQLKAGKNRQEIERALSKRAQSMLPTGKPVAIAVDAATLAGDPQAPVQVVVYACARCPYCKVVVPALYREVTAGSLQGKARLYFRPFPLKDHAGSTEGGLALIGAARLGGFWPLALKLYQRFDAFKPELLAAWAVETGLDQAAFEKEIADPKNRQSLVASKQEGIRNKVEATPTLFIDGRRYVYDVQPEAIVDVLLEAYEARSAAR